MRQREFPHNTPEQVRLYLEAALELTEQSDVPEDLRVAFFSNAVNLLSAKQIVMEQVGMAGVPNLALPH